MNEQDKSFDKEYDSFKKTKCFYGLEDFLNRKLEDIEFDIEDFEFVLKRSEKGIKIFNSEEINYMQSLIHDIYNRVDDINKELRDILIILHKIKTNNTKEI